MTAERVADRYPRALPGPAVAQSGHAVVPPIISGRRAGMPKRSCCAAGIAAILTMTAVFMDTAAQELPDTLWIPVIFYDYHADASTGDFEQPFGGDCHFGLLENMVKEKISDDRKPVPNPPRNLFGCASHLDEWYRPSGNDGPAANSQFAFNSDNIRWEWTNLVPRQGGTAGEYVATDYNPDYDRATIVIYDSLPFVHVPSEGEGTYRFSRTGKDEPGFFWINDRGFGNEGKGGNYAFTMEMHHDFTYREGLKFDFNGDDDVWVFINDSLVLDLGGSHGPTDGSFDVDDIPGLELGKNYHFDFFYAERHTFASTIRITTNILTPMKLEIIVKDDTISAGSLGRLEAAIRDSAGNRQTDKEALVTWELGDTAPGDTLTVNEGATTQIGATKAYRRVRVDAKYIDPNVPTYVLDGSAYVYIGHGPASHVWIEELTNDSVSSLNEPDTVEEISVSLSEDSVNAYAVLRDKFNNYVSLANSAQWSSAAPTRVGAMPTTGRAWTGIIYRGTSSNAVDTVEITASQPGLTPDRVPVVMAFTLQVATPAIYPAGGTYGGSMTLDSITCTTPGARIWYTTDGSDPAAGGGGTTKRYSPTEPVIISAPGETVVKAIADHPDEQKYKPSEIAQQVFTNIDYTGPSVSKASYFLANPPGKSDNPYDTVVVTFNEPVKSESLRNTSTPNVFKYFDYDTPGLSEDQIFSGSQYSAETQTALQSDSTVLSVTILLSNTGKVTPIEDSLRLKEGTVADRYGNLTPANSAKVKIEWGRDYGFVTASAPNPFTPNVNTVPSAIRGSIDMARAQQMDNYEPIPHSATIVQVSSVATLKPEGSYGVIYDAVGNQLTGQLPFYPTTAKNDNRFYLFWDGRNRNNRFVASGTYLAMIYIKQEGSDRVSVERQKIGVKR